MAIRSSNRFDFSDTVHKILSNYGIEVQEVMLEVIPEVAKDAAQKLRKTSPKKTGDYAKGWKYKVDKKRLRVGAVIYNKDRYRLTHLLENGHAKRGGGRVASRDHIAPVNDWAADEVMDRLMDRLEREMR